MLTMHCFNSNRLFEGCKTTHTWMLHGVYIYITVTQLATVTVLLHSSAVGVMVMGIKNCFKMHD